MVNFSASWCGPCRLIAPYYCELSEKYPALTFLTIDVDELSVRNISLGFPSLISMILMNYILEPYLVSELMIVMTRFSDQMNYQFIIIIIINFAARET